MAGKRVLITGAAGFVGAHLAARLSIDGHQVHALLHPSSNRWRLAAAEVAFEPHAADLADDASVQRVVGAVRPEWIFHLAAHGAYAWHDNRRRMIDANLAGTQHLMDACARTGFDAFVHAGSSSEYGSRDHAVSEDERPEPDSMYAVTKLAATQYCQHVARAMRLPVVTLRLYTVYGPMEEPGRLMPALVLRALDGGYPPLARPDAAHDYVYVDDAIDAFLRAAGRAGDAAGIYNVGSGVSTTLRQLVETIGDTFGVRAQPCWGTFPPRPWDTCVWAADARRIRERLGWQSRRSLVDGVRAVAEWFVQYPAMRARYAETARGTAPAAGT